MLSVVVPERNNPVGLEALLDMIGRIPAVAQVVIVDDASDSWTAEDSSWTLEGGARVTMRRLPTRSGAGVARNKAMALVDQSMTLFFDSDDSLYPGLDALIRQLHPREFDFCMFRHDHSRAPGGFGMLQTDEVLWSRVRATGRIPQDSPLDLSTDLDARVQMSRVAAFPWNKVYRTDFLRDSAIQCGSTLVHNDILLHWHSFHATTRILMADSSLAAHTVDARAANLTNLAGLERLELFIALAESAQLMTTRPVGDPLRSAFFCFALDVMTWAQETVHARVALDFARMRREFLLRYLTPPDFWVLSRQEPRRAAAALSWIRDVG